MSRPTPPSHAALPARTLEETRECIMAAITAVFVLATSFIPQRGSPREHGEAGEHRTFPGASTVAGSRSVGGSQSGVGARALKPP